MNNNPVKIIIVVIILAVLGVFAYQNFNKPINNPPVDSTKISPVYTDNQYGFSIALPNSWVGYTILNSQWEGRDIATGTVTEHGPEITLRHPLWTEANPREDMPVMVFTTAQWAIVNSGKIALGAAPIAPGVLGKNSKYVIALPARYNYDYKTGWEEVDTLVNQLKVFEPK